jgi:hypothetical protein
LAAQAAQFIGTWKLISQHTVTPDGQRIPTRGEHPAGVLMYDPFGNMSVQLMRTDEQASTYTDLREFDTAMEGYHAYFGTYEIDPHEPIIRHHVIGSAFPGYVGSVQVRYYEFHGDELTLVVKPADGSQRVLLWQKITAPGQFKFAR